MPRKAADHGTYRAYLRCRKRPEGACAVCVAAKDQRSAQASAQARARRAGEREPAVPVVPVLPPPPMPTTDEGHVSRLEVLKEMLQTSRELIPVLKVSDPTRAYLLMREQRDILREISELQGNGQVKGVTLADQLAEARAARARRSATA